MESPTQDSDKTPVKAVALTRKPSTSEGIVISEPSDTIFKQYGSTKRGLSNRHLQLMVISSAIGTGLFLGVGSSLRTAGPLSVVLAFIIYPTIFILPCTLGMAEMATHLPIRGAISEFASRYIDPAFGFALGWTYFYGSAMLFCAELSAVVTVMGYWEINVNSAVWVAMALGLCLFLNLFAVRWYGESEFVFSCTKVLLLVGLLLVTLITMCGGNPTHWAYGFYNWTSGEVMHEYMGTGAKGRFLGFWSVMLYAAFAISGPDFIALTAGEMEDPRRNIPRCARATWLRIFLFYVLGTVGLGTICSSRDPRLLSALAAGSAGSAASPWVIGIQNLGIGGLAGFINALILMSGWSCGNAMLYSASRTLYSLALDGQAPRFFLRCTKSGIPVYCVLAVALISCITFLVASNDGATVFEWFIGLSTCAFVIAYTAMLITYIGWYRALKAQGVSRDTLHWKAPLMPYSAYFATGVGCVVLFFLGFDVFSPFSVSGFVTSYFGAAFMFVCYVGAKIFKRTKFVKPREADIWSGKEVVDMECSQWDTCQPDESKSLMRRLWAMIW